MTTRTLGVLPLLLLAACGRGTTLLADMGDVDVTMYYDVNATKVDVPGQPDALVGSAGLSLIAGEGCPTFIGEGTFLGDPMTVAEEGHSELGVQLLVFPVQTCFAPSLEGPDTRELSEDSLDVSLEDISATWSIRHEGGMNGAYTRVGEGALHAGESFELAWEGPGTPTYVFVDGDLHERPDNGAVETLRLTVSEDTAPGTVGFGVEAPVQYEAESCDGPSACTVWATFTHWVEVVVE